jgi:exodeoxyribonuclease VII small subunit
VASRTKKIDFEANISALQELVEKMERGDFTLEESVTQFEHGMTLAKNCQLALREAEVKVSQLMTSAQGDEKLVALDEPDTDEA